jgi:hypothetical protein
MSENSVTLSELLRALFPDNESLLEFVLRLDGGAAVADALPNTDVSKQKYRSKAADHLFAHGLVDNAFFALLEHDRPKFAATIRRAQATLHLTATNGVATTAPRKSLLRALQPFDQDDTLFGRDMEVQDIETLVTGADFRFGVVFGRTGCGKTSLLRAGLMPRLIARGFTAIYLPRPIDLMRTLHDALATNSQDAALAGTIVVVDQFEELFLQQPAKDAHADLAMLIAQCMRAGPASIRVLVGIREDLCSRLLYLTPHVPEPLRSANSYLLEEFRPETAAAILRASRDTDGTEFDDSLIRAVVDELGPEGLVRPVELQIVATTLKRRRVRRESVYATLGGAEGLLRTYIEGEIAATPHRLAAARMLRRLCNPDRPGKAPVDVTTDELVEHLRHDGIDTADTTMVEETLTQLRQARLVVETQQGRYNLIHDYLARLVILATEGTESETVKATRLLGRYVADYQSDSAVRIPRAHLLRLRRHARAAIASNPLAQRLVRASVRSVLAHAVLPSLVLLCVALASAYVVLSTTSYLSTQPAAFVAAGQDIVVRTGHPALQLLPGFDEVIVDTGYAMNDVIQEPSLSIYDIPRELLWVFNGRVSGRYETWAALLADRLTTPDRIYTYRMLGDWANAANVAVTTALRAGELQRGSLNVMPMTLVPDDALEAGKFFATLLEPLDEVGRGLIEPLQRYLTASGAASHDQESIYGYLLQRQLEADGRKPESARSSWMSRLVDEHALRLLVMNHAGLVRGDDAVRVFRQMIARSTELERKYPLLATLEIMLLANADAAGTLLPIFVEALVEQTDDSDWKQLGLAREAFSMLSRVVRVHPQVVDDASLKRLADKAEEENIIGIAYGILASQRSAVSNEAPPVQLLRCSAQEASSGQRSFVADACALALVRAGKDDADRHQLKRSLASRNEYVADLAGHLALTSNGGLREYMTPAQQKGHVIDAIRGQIGLEFGYEDLDRRNFIYEIGRMHRSLIQDDAIALLVESFTSYWSVTQGGTAATLLFDAARWQPGKILASSPRFRAWKRSSLSPVDAIGFRETALAILARARYEQRRLCLVPGCAGGVKLDEIADLLATRTNYETRVDGVYAAYLRWLDTPADRQSIETLLATQAERPEPDLRITANMAREMIRVGAQTEVGDHITPGLALARIRYLESQNNIHIRFAARLAMERWIDATAATRRRL